MIIQVPEILSSWVGKTCPVLTTLTDRASWWGWPTTTAYSVFAFSSWETCAAKKWLMISNVYVIYIYILLLLVLNYYIIYIWYVYIYMYIISMDKWLWTTNSPTRKVRPHGNSLCFAASWLRFPFGFPANTTIYEDHFVQKHEPSKYTGRNDY